MKEPVSESVLLFRVADYTCALKMADVVEIMRPQPVSPIAEAPDYVHGLSIIRGEPVPVVSLASLLGRPAGTAKRLVLVRVGKRRVALAVDEVLGIFELSPDALKSLPPLVAEGTAALASVAALDEQLLLLLNSGAIVPVAIWERMDPLPA